MERAAVIERAILEELAEHPASIGQLYCRLAARGMVPHNFDERYAVKRHVEFMAIEGRLPHDRVLEGHLWARRPDAGHGNVDLRAQHSTHVEVWCDRHDMMGVVSEIAAPYGVATVPAGIGTSPFHWRELAADIKCHRKPVYILAVGSLKAGRVCDLLTSTVCANRVLPGRSVTIEQVAVTPEQAKFHRLLALAGDTIPPEALPPHAFRVSLKSAIERRIGQRTGSPHGAAGTGGAVGQ